MNQKSGTWKDAPDRSVRDITRKTPKHCPVWDELRTADMFRNKTSQANAL